MSRSAPDHAPRRRPAKRWLAAAAATAALVPALLAASATPAAAAASFTVSKTTGLSMDGELVTVTGSGLNTSYGVYIVFCRDVGAAIPDQAADCAPGGDAVFSHAGSFTRTIQVVPRWGDVDCTVEVCGVRTMNDHRSFDFNNEHDSFTPVTFDVPTSSTSTTTSTTSTTVAQGSSTTVPQGQGGGVETQNRTRITLSKSTDLSGGEVINVTGTGFVPNQGVYVQLCAAPAGTLGTAAGRTTACYPEQDGSHTVWITPVPASGNWATPLTVADAFADVDCRTQSCGVFVRRDHSGGATDYSQDAFAPISFGGSGTPTTSPGAIGARLTVTPSSGIVSGSIIRVEGAGFRAGHELFVGVCDVAVANYAACDFENVQQVQVEHGGTARAGGPGTFVVELVARARFGTTDCAGSTSRCAVATWAVSGNEAALEVEELISFATGAAGGSDQGGAPTASGGRSPLARTGSDTTQLVLIGTLAIVVGAGLYAVGRRRVA